MEDFKRTIGKSFQKIKLLKTFPKQLIDASKKKSQWKLFKDLVDKKILKVI